MRHPGLVAVQSFPPMKPSSTRISPMDAGWLVARLHDATAALALGLGFLKSDQSHPGRQRSGLDSLELISHALANLKQRQAGLTRTQPAPRRLDLIAMLRQQADRLRLKLDLRVSGSTDWLPPTVVELLLFASREALLNVRRHSGTRACRIELDFASCPFTFRARDWGAGLRAGSGAGHGLSLLRDLADPLGCRVVVASQPGLGTELVVFGNRCALSPMSSLVQEAASS